MSARYILKALAISFVVFFEVHAQDPVNDQENLGQGVNSPYNELDPVLSPDGQSLYFTRTRHPNNIGGSKDPGDIWVTALDADQWSEARNLGTPFNSKDLNAVIGFSNDGTIMYMQNLSKNRKGGISFSRKTASGWSNPQEMPIQYFYNKSDLQSMCISNDGKIIIMSVESFSTYGAEDLYVSFLQSDGTWSEPRNLGTAVNTKYQEMTPKLADDNVTLFFSSNGHGGFGGRDIFLTKRLDDTWRNWSTPQNLGRKVNTKGVELSYFIPNNGDFAYMVSTQNSDGYGDLKRVRIKPEDRPNNLVESLPPDPPEVDPFPEPDTVLIISQQEPVEEPTDSTNETIELIKTIVTKPAYTIDGQVTNSETSNPVYARITIHSFPEGEELASVATNVSNGQYQINLPTDTRYELKIKADGYLGYNAVLELNQGEEEQLQTDFQLTPIEVGVTIQLPNVLFERSTTNLLSESFEELDRVSDLLMEYPNMEIALSGHTDNQGSAKLNLKLSQDRVETVLLYLVGKGVDRNRLSGKGYGGTKPIASNKSESTRKLNRRVEFTIIKK
ncbi:MAG: OmpA family protein [Cyclobacteriaceae bacterium]|nr:OmpA family protein [Cyclobacteriaceae bacterium]